MTERTKVKCPECGKEKTSRGTETFRHCGTTHSIEQNIVSDNSSDTLDPEAALGNEDAPNQSQDSQNTSNNNSNPEDSEDSEQEQEQEEHEYNCSNCGEGFDRKLLKCPNCSKRFNWDAVA